MSSSSVCRKPMRPSSGERAITLSAASASVSPLRARSCATRRLLLLDDGDERLDAENERWCSRASPI